MHRLTAAVTTAALALLVPATAHAATDASPVDHVAGLTYVAGAQSWAGASFAFYAAPGQPGHVYYAVDHSQFFDDGGYHIDYDEIVATVPAEDIHIAADLSTATLSPTTLSLHHMEMTIGSDSSIRDVVDTTTPVQVSADLAATAAQEVGHHVDHYVGGDGPGSAWLDVSASRSRSAAGSYTIGDVTTPAAVDENGNAGINEGTTSLLYRSAS